MRCRFAFSQTSDGRLLVTMEALWGFPAGQNGRFCVSAIDDENTFIQHVVLANLEKQDTIEMVASILLVVSGREPADRWITITANRLQLTALGMRLEFSEEAENGPVSPLAFAQGGELEQVFMQAPLPICMLSGPQHIVTFINPPYVRITARTSTADFLHKPIREAFYDLEGQQFFPLLDQVFTSGEPYIGIEVPAQIFHADEGTRKEHFFDFIYHPVRDRTGAVSGILCLASDVTERVLERNVRDSREEKLYQQWAEMNALYREAPFGMCLISAHDTSILRLNEIKAQILGGTVEGMIGKKMTDLYPDHPFIPETYLSVIAQKKSLNFELTMELPSDPGRPRTWWWNLNPVYDASGEVESILSVVIELTARPTVINAQSSEAAAATVPEGELAQR